MNKQNALNNSHPTTIGTIKSYMKKIGDFILDVLCIF